MIIVGMLTIPQSALQRVRFIGHRWFHKFGIHCATHQIRLILISAVVITSLLFPAIHLYFPSQIHTFALRLHALDSFLTPDDISSYFSQQDTRSIWEGYHDLHVREDNVARARCGVEGLLRLERVLVHSPFHDGPSSALNKETLLATLELENRIAEVLAARKLPCLRTRDGSCLSISPLAYWNHDAKLLVSDTNLLGTISSSRNVSSSSILINPDMVLAGREASDSPERDVDSAMFLVLSYFFPDTDCLGNVGHFAWLHALEDAVSSKGELILQARVPDLIALDYRANSRISRTSVLSLFSYVVYSAFAVYFYRSMRRMDKVHSRLGLAFTGIVEIFVSTLTSLSMCYLAGFKFTLIPWEIFPIVVIFIGVENMFSLIDAVVKTSITLPVKIRVAEGLSRAGTSNSLKLFWYNAVLGLIAGVSTGAIQQFCTFAVAVLVAHWFLVHTFFVAVLSIDIQRLELEELLRQDSSITPEGSKDSTQAGDKTPDTPSGRFMAAIGGRPTKNISLVLLLAIAATLYYATLPSHVRVDATRGVSSRHSKMRNSEYSVPESTSPAYNVWRVLNPLEDEMVHVRMESPAIIILNSEDQSSVNFSSEPDRHPIKDYDWTRRSKLGLFFARLMRPVAWFFKIVVVPMIFTIIALYGLLLYLLKDAELLEVQRNRAAANDAEVKEEPEAPANIPVTYGALPRAFPTDIDLVASSEDGSIVISVGLQNELVLWRKDRGYVSTTAIDTSDIVIGTGSGLSAASTLTALAVNEDGTFCAVGSGTGIIALWYIGHESVKPLQLLSVDTHISAVTSIQFVSKNSNSNANSGHVSPLPGISLSAHPPSVGSVYAAYESGTVIQWTVTSFAVPTYILPTRSASVSKALLETIRHDGRIIIGFALDDGGLELLDVEHADDLLHRELCITAGNPSDLVNRLQICKVELEGEERIIIAASTHAGVVSLWDGRTAECIYILDEPFGDISSLRLVPSPTETCGICGELPFENFVLALSTGQLVLFYRAYLSNPTRRCSCVHNQPKPQLRASVLGRRSRSGSAASTSGVMTPTHGYCRTRNPVVIAPATPTQEEPPMFPISAHGVHSRRSSDKEILRRNLENFVASDQDESDLPLGPQDIAVQASSAFLSSDARSSVWQNLVVVRIDDTTCERGGWDVVETRGGYYKVVGIRRKPRQPFARPKARSSKTSPPKVQLRSQGPTGLTPSDLERWEFWTFNPSDSKLEASLLQSLRDRPLTVPSVRSKNILGSGGVPLSPRRRAGWEMIPRLHFTRVSPVTGGKLHCLAGFGNTVVSFNFDGHLLLSVPVWNKITQPPDRPRETSHH